MEAPIRRRRPAVSRGRTDLSFVNRNLRLGRIVVADCVNPWPLTRGEWRAVADRTGVPALGVEIVCSDAGEHRRRVETRATDITGHRLPTWQEVVERDYRAWDVERMVIDTARLSVEQTCSRFSPKYPPTCT